MFTILGIGTDMFVNDVKLPTLSMPARFGNDYHFFAPTVNGLRVKVTLPPYVALVATMDGTNLIHESTASFPEMVEGRFPNYFLADEYSAGGPIWLQNARWDTGMKFVMQGAEQALKLSFYLPAELPLGLPEKGMTWMGNQIKTEEERYLEQRGTGGMSGLRAGPFEPRPIPPPLTPDYFSRMAFFTAEVKFMTVCDFNNLANACGSSPFIE